MKRGKMESFSLRKASHLGFYMPSKLARGTEGGQGLPHVPLTCICGLIRNRHL